METKSNHSPGADAPGPAASAADRDPTLEELAALENEVDNWLRPPAKARAEPAPLAMAEPEVTVEPAMTVEPAVTVEPEAVVAPPPSPRARPRTPWWALGIGAAAAAAIGFAVIGNEQKQSDWAQETPATDARAIPQAPAAPAVPAPATADSKPVDMVFLKEPAAAGAKAAIQPTEQATVEPEPPADTVEDEEKPAAVPPPARVERVAAARKPAVRSMTADAMAEHLESRRPARRGSDRERLDKAIIQCNSNSRDPGACNLRACDVLGPSHPACRE